MKEQVAQEKYGASFDELPGERRSRPGPKRSERVGRSTHAVPILRWPGCPRDGRHDDAVSGVMRSLALDLPDQ